MKTTDWNAIYDREDAVFEITKDFNGEGRHSADYLRLKIEVVKAMIRGEGVPTYELTDKPLPNGGLNKAELKHIKSYIESWLRVALKDDPRQIRNDRARDNRYARKLGLSPAELRAKF